MPCQGDDYAFGTQENLSGCPEPFRGPPGALPGALFRCHRSAPRRSKHGGYHPGKGTSFLVDDFGWKILGDDFFLFSKLAPGGCWMFSKWMVFSTRMTPMLKMGDSTCFFVFSRLFWEVSTRPWCTVVRSPVSMNPYNLRLLNCIQL